jgi:hypothetical protein
LNAVNHSKGSADLIYARALFLPARLQRKISGKGEPLPDGDSGK